MARSDKQTQLEISSRLVTRFFDELSDSLTQIERETESALHFFFEELEPRIDASRSIEVELNRVHASRFNVLDYLRDDEIGLSSIIADLLDPTAKHGQDIMFLRLFLQKLDFAMELRDGELKRTVVVTERTIEDNRRIDIYVRIPHDSGDFCIAIENKPYSGDGDRQIHDYLNHLRNRYESRRFRMIYLTGSGMPPSKESLPRDELPRIQQNAELSIVTYAGIQFSEENQHDVLDSLYARFSLTEWLESCSEDCQVEKLRSFLTDIQSYCRQKFGEHQVISDREIDTVRQYLLTKPENLNIALSVYEAWPVIRDSICKSFLEHLYTDIQRALREELKLSPEYVIEYQFVGEKTYGNGIWLYGVGWRESEGTVPPLGRTAIMLENQGKWPTGWILGIRSPSSESNDAEEQNRRRQLERKLNDKLGQQYKSLWWRWYRRIDDEYGNWDDRIADLVHESKGNEGKRTTTDHFTSEFVELVNRTIQIVDEIERK